MTPDMLSMENSPQTDFRGAHGVVMQVEAPRLLPWLMFCSIVSGLALGLAILAVVLGQQSEREARLAQYDAQLLRSKVAAIGVEIDDHAEDKHK